MEKMLKIWKLMRKKDQETKQSATSNSTQVIQYVFTKISISFCSNYANSWSLVFEKTSE